MSRDHGPYASRRALAEELAEMKRKFLALEECRGEFDRIRSKYDHLLASAPDAMVFVDRDARIHLLNSQLADLFGYREDELRGKDLEILIPERFRKRHRENVRSYFAQPHVRKMGSSLSIYGLRRDGTEFPADISLSPLDTEDGIVAVAAIRDLTERRRQEDERHLLLQRLAEAEKLSALGRIAANVADEIRNPLTAVGGFARRLSKIADSDREREYAEHIFSEVQRLEGILRDVLAYSHARSPLLADSDLCGVVDSALALSGERRQAQSIELRKECPERFIVRVDRGQAGEAIERLIANSLDAMHSGGTLTVAVDRSNVGGLPFVRLRIQDTGEGIPRANLGKIFEPFFSTRVSPKGTGLGLSIAKKVVEEEGGSISIESIEGAGTTVTLLFPDVQQTAAGFDIRPADSNIRPRSSGALQPGPGEDTASRPRT